jgi:uncharacterized repeat protein (TIGR01451 family)
VGTPPSHGRRSPVPSRALLVAGVFVCALAIFPAITIGAHGQERLNDDNDEKKVTICHRDSDPKQPYGPKAQSVSVNSILGDNGHAGHTGPVWQPAPDTPSEWGDIIPAFTYEDNKGEIQVFAGLNWPDNTGIFQDDCQPTGPEPPSPTRIAVVKSVLPSDGPGTFDLKVGNTTVAEGAGDKGHGVTDVEPGASYTVSESGAGETDLDDYTTESRCTAPGGPDVGTSSSDGRSVTGVTVAEGKTVTCAFTNTAKLPPDSESVTPELECVLFKDRQPDVAYWSYDNANGHLVTVPIGPQNTFEPASANGEGTPPTTFLAGRHVGAFTTDVPSGGLVWHLTGKTATASAGAEPCKATIEVRKVAVPSDDPGRFNLLVDNALVATGGHGTTSGHLAIGAGEATVRETAGPRTSLGDYTSKVECTNGTDTVSVQGTKLDATIGKDDSVVCTFTNTRKGTQPVPPEPLPPTPTDPDPPPVPPTPPRPTPQLDLVVTKSVEPETVVVGGRLTWTMTVTNRSSVAAADVNAVKVDDPRSFRTRLISLRASQGTCRPYTCNLGRLAPGASARVIAVTEATQEGVVANIVRVSSEEPESNYRNNVAAAIAQVVGRLAPPVSRQRCATLTVSPRVLQNRRSSVVLLTALDGRGRPLAGMRVRARGPGVDTTVTTDRRGTVRRTVLPGRAGLFFFTGLPRGRTGGGLHCRTLLGVLAASDTRVTG